MCRELSILNRYRGIPYLLNGRDFHGADCLGLVWLYLRDQGIVIPDGDGMVIDASWSEAAEKRFIAKLEEVAVKVDAPAPNDIVLIHWKHQAAHLGVMVDCCHMLHGMEDRTSEICPVAFFGHRILGFWRVVR